MREDNWDGWIFAKLFFALNSDWDKIEVKKAQKINTVNK